ncbi:MAG: tRNA uridine-5-carboxymethylaminomethyl(34) synthesis GTPase MnmE [Alphaproteobacteria bacterium]
MKDKDTIFALASGMGKAGVAVIRISGSNADKAVYKMTKNAAKILAKPRYAFFEALYNPVTNEPIDESLIIYFKAPYSFTGEDIVELHIHGGRAVINDVLKSLIKIDGFRPAEAGEYSLRAFLNNKMDLTEAEGLCDIIDAETSSQRQQALRQLKGHLKDFYEDLRKQLVASLSHMEAYLDFPEEEIPEDVTLAIQNNISLLINKISQYVDDKQYGEKIRDGFSVAIIGEPNVGKSSIINQLTKRNVSIVSDVEGTTRDIIDVHFEINGILVNISDTAGIRTTFDKVEKEGVERAVNCAENADIIVYVFDNYEKLKNPDDNFNDIINDKSNIIYVLNKADLLNQKIELEHKDNKIFLVSALTGLGLKELVEEISKVISETDLLNSAPVITRARHRYALEKTLEALKRFDLSNNLDIACEDLRIATRFLGTITGVVDVEEILDNIFSKFCIGK